MKFKRLKIEKLLTLRVLLGENDFHMEKWSIQVKQTSFINFIMFSKKIFFKLFKSWIATLRSYFFIKDFVAWQVKKIWNNLRALKVQWFCLDFKVHRSNKILMLDIEIFSLKNDFVIDNLLRL